MAHKKWNRKNHEDKYMIVGTVGPINSGIGGIM